MYIPFFKIDKITIILYTYLIKNGINLLHIYENKLYNKKVSLLGGKYL